MDSPPPGDFQDIMKAYGRHAGDIRSAWDTIHGR